MSTDFTGKVALVTGAAGGMGRATALAFARAGAAVVVADIAETAQQTVDDIRDSDGRATFVRTDVANSSDVQAMVNTASTSSAACTARSTRPRSSARPPTSPTARTRPTIASSRSM